VVTGSTLTMSGSAGIAVDGGVNATVNSVVAGTRGVTQSGAGVLILGGSNTYSGGTTVGGGTLRISADSALGAVPGSLATNITLDGGTLQFGASFNIANTRGINLGAVG